MLLSVTEDISQQLFIKKKSGTLTKLKSGNTLSKNKMSYRNRSHKKKEWLGNKQNAIVLTLLTQIF